MNSIRVAGKEKLQKNNAGFSCPECGSPMTPESACFYCRFCGYSACPAV